MGNSQSRRRDVRDLEGDGIPLNTSWSRQSSRQAKYSTFHDVDHRIHSNTPTKTSISRFKWLQTMFMQPLVASKSILPFDMERMQRDAFGPNFWKMIFAVAIWALFFQRLLRSSGSGPLQTPQWIWDHNVYAPKSDASPASFDLIVQVVPNMALNELADVTSRPTRAYARQWRIDYARYDSNLIAANTRDQRSCLVKVDVLKSIVDRQSPSSWLLHRGPRYGRVLLLPADSVLIDLDKRIFDALLPNRDKVVALAGWNGDPPTLHRSSGIVVVNLDHPRTSEILDEWKALTSPTEITCGDGNELGIFITAIYNTLRPGEAIEDFIHPIEESEEGVLGDAQVGKLIKSLVLPVPASRSANIATRPQDYYAIAHETADSVCYRYFPRCEV